MKNFVIRFFSFIAILFIVDSLIKGFDIADLGSYLLFAFLLTLTYIALAPIIKFFTLPINLLTLGIFNFIISCFYIYFFKLIIPGFEITQGSIGPLFNKEIQLSEISLSLFAVIIISSLLITFLNNIISWAMDDKKK